MGLRMRKSINLGGGVRLNLSKSGIGISAGVKGARVSIGPRGIRTSVGIPGTGIYYSTEQSLRSLGAPRAKSPVYQQTISNPYLGVSKTIKARNPEELKAKVTAQLATWKEREENLRQKQAVAETKARAERMTQEAQRKLEAYKTVLASSLDKDYRLDWESLLRKDEYPIFVFDEKRPQRTFDEPEPTLAGTFARLKVPKPSFVERLFPARKERRLSAERKAREVFEEELRSFQHRKEAAELEYQRRLLLHALRRTVAWKRYLAAKAEFERKKAKHNQRVRDCEAAFKAGEPDAIREYFKFVFSKLEAPQSSREDTDIAYDKASGTLDVTLRLPAPESLPDVVSYKYDSAAGAIVPKKLSQQGIRKLYEDFACQSVLRAAYVAFQADCLGCLSNVSVKATRRGIDPATGHMTDLCAVTLNVARDRFMEVNLAAVDAKKCLRALGASFGLFH